MNIPDTPRYYYLGYVQSRRDERDYSLDHPAFKSMMAQVPEVLPQKVDLRKFAAPVMDQGKLGSCTANALDILARILYAKMGKQTDFTGSRLDVYWNTRAKEGTIFQDAGATIADTMATFIKEGVPKESIDPYVIKNFKKAPSRAGVKDGLTRRATAYARIDKPGMAPSDILDGIHQVLAAGYAVEFGTNVYKSIFDVGPDGLIPAAPTGLERPVGGHALPIIGYDLAKKLLIVQNSWGPGWGENGIGYLPESYFEKGYGGHPDADDVWVATAASWHK